MSFLDNKNILQTKKLLSSYKERLEEEIINRSNKLRIPKDIFKEIIEGNNELKELKRALKELEKNSSSAYLTED